MEVIKDAISGLGYYYISLLVEILVLSLTISLVVFVMKHLISIGK